MAKAESKIRMARGLRFGYEKIPAEVTMIPEAVLGSMGKRLCGHIGSFGVNGCYQSKVTLGRYFGVSRWTMIRLVKQLKMLRLIVWVQTNGVPGCMWLRVNPKVQAAEVLFYRGRSVKNPACTCSKPATAPVANAPQAPVANAPHNYNKTNKNTTAASLSPDEAQAQRREKAEADAQSRTQSHIRVEIVQHLPLVSVVDLGAKQRQILVIAEFEEKAEELVRDGMSVDDAVKKVLGKKYVKAREESL